MLLTLTATMPDATDLGFLLHKHPDKAQTFGTSVGQAHVLWPQATKERSTVALLLEVDPIALVRGKARGADAASLAQYVNDRPYAASSMLSVALGKVFATAMSGRCDSRPELAKTRIDLDVHLPALPSRGGPQMVEQLFGPLGWQVTATPIVLDPTVPAWGDSAYVDARLTGSMLIADALRHLYVLMPVLDESKHYWIGTDEVDKLMRAGSGWLAEHPDRELITSRYLGHHRDLVTDATERLDALDDQSAEPEPAEQTTPLAHLRRTAVIAELMAHKATSVVDLGCGEGALLKELIADPRFERVLGVDVSHRALERAAKRLSADRTSDSQRARLELIQSSLTYRDDRLQGYDAVVLMEVIEHVDPSRLPALERSVFAHAKPTSVIVTTPNAEYNVRYERLSAGTMRHPDHRFEWTRAEFAHWAEAAAATYGYDVSYRPVGEDDPAVGPPTQMAVFRRRR